MKLRVLIVDDNPAVRQAFGAAVAATPDMQAVGLTADRAEGARLLRAGGSPISAVIARQLLMRFADPTAALADVATFSAALAPALPGGPGAPDEASPRDKAALLSPREREVLLLCAKGYSYEEIAPLLAVSRHTVTSFVKRIYRKLQLHSKTEAVYEARRMGYLDE